MKDPARHQLFRISFLVCLNIEGLLELFPSSPHDISKPHKPGKHALFSDINYLVYPINMLGCPYHQRSKGAFAPLT